MVSLTASSLSTLVNDAGLAAATAEAILDQAIDCLNLLGNLELSNMQGTAASKSVGVTSRERGAILYVARAIYSSFYKDAPTTAVIAGLSVSTTDVLSNAVVMHTVEAMARKLHDADWSHAII